MNFTYTSPESRGVSSASIKAYLERLENANLATHSMIIARGNDIIFEKYYKPFDKDFLHREYSDSKSIVSLAVGFAIQDGLLDINDPIGKYFPDELVGQTDPGMGDQTIRNMLMMSTPKSDPYWFNQRTDDRVRAYFQKAKTSAPLGSEFFYDSTGSFILGALVERLTGKDFVSYLREKLLDRIGVSKDFHCLKCPGGHSWGDSAILAKATDMLKIGRFILDSGKVDGEQILSAEYLAEATSNLISTASEGKAYCSQGYGYLIWRTHDNSWFFSGMGSQFVIGNPEKDFLFVINSDNQGIGTAASTIIDSFFELIVRPAVDSLPENPTMKAELDAYADSLILSVEKGEMHSPLEAKIDGTTYVLDQNPLGITDIRFDFAKNHGLFTYTNATGKKSIAFGLGANVFGVFPEEGYSRMVGSVYAPGNYYKSATSAAWKSENELLVNVQVIDEYFGRLWMTFKFDGDEIKISMRKVAEDFFHTYSGEAKGHRQ